ncbi:hypothetical protein B0H17DRAFT_1331679 [Mycena rosella]|uniref:DUF6534 domain-containing protein n=1 Tax=Mycena rosella TaxID=1033263 RepID=A0AAD7DEU9_MYCRO|nr:hypothetical protein B0H17DRAFT_1331679 [Mycena rosella]
MAGVELIFGPLLIGVVLNMMLYGIMSIQMFTYYQRYPSDSAWIRYLMLYLFLAETANVVVQVGIVYEPLIIQERDVAIAVSPKLLPGDSILIAIVSAPIQLFQAWRISVITGSFIIPALIALLSFASLAGGLLVSVLVSVTRQFRNFQSFSTEVSFWLGCSAACDIAIAVAMSRALYVRKTGFGVVDGQINRIIRLTIESGSATAIMALADVILFLLFPKTLVNFIVDFPLSNLYTCSVLAMLNSRERAKVVDTEHTHPAPQLLARTQTSVQSRPSVNKPPQASLKIYTSTERLVATDDGDLHSDFYNYNAQPRTGLTHSSPRSKNIGASHRPMPERF